MKQLLVLIHFGLALRRAKRTEGVRQEVEPWVRDQVNSLLPDVGVEFAWKPEAACDCRSWSGNQFIDVAIVRVIYFQFSLTNAIDSLVLEDVDESWEEKLDHPVHGQGRVVGVNHNIGLLRRRKNHQAQFDSVWKLLIQLLHQKGTQTRTSASRYWVHQLKSFEVIALFGLPPNCVHQAMDELASLSVVADCPVVAGWSKPRDEVVGAVQFSKRRCSSFVDGAWLEISKDGAGGKLVVGVLVEEHVDPLSLEITHSWLLTVGIDRMLLGYVV